MPGPDLHAIAVWLFISVIAITFHEAAHGWMAFKRGDRTAYMLGRVSFNPARHIDTVGTILLPVMMQLSGVPFLFGWAKPVPVNYRNLKNIRLDSLLVAAAGPAANLILAIIAIVLVRVVYEWANYNPDVALGLLSIFIKAAYLNMNLAFFNMLPIPPLDGSKVLASILPPRYAIYLARLEQHGLVIVLGCLMVLPWLLSMLGIQVNPLGWLVGAPSQAVINGLMKLVGLSELS